MRFDCLLFLFVFFYIGRFALIVFFFFGDGKGGLIESVIIWYLGATKGGGRGRVSWNGGRPKAFIVSPIPANTLSLEVT